MFRHHVLLCFLRDRGIDDEVLVELKDVLRWLAARELLELGFSCEVDPEDPALTVQLACTYKGPAVAELSCLEGLNGGRRKAHGGGRKKRRRMEGKGKGK